MATACWRRDIDSSSIDPGGLAEDVPRGFEAECRKFVEWMPKAIDEYEAILSRNV